MPKLPHNLALWARRHLRPLIGSALLAGILLTLSYGSHADASTGTAHFNVRATSPASADGDGAANPVSGNAVYRQSA